MTKAAILQSNYIPWKGVFDMMHQVDIFVFEDDVQYTKQDWRNRNKIVTNDGLKWITVPVKNSNNINQLICEVLIANDTDWQRKHYNLFKTYYSKAPYFKDYQWVLEEIYVNHNWTRLTELNLYINKLIANILGIKSIFMYSTDMNIKGKKDDRVIEICKNIGATHYLSGPAAKNYISKEKFDKENIVLEYIEYNYPEYKQQYGNFDHYVTVLDVLFNCGAETPYYIWGWRDK